MCLFMVFAFALLLCVTASHSDRRNGAASADMKSMFHGFGFAYQFLCGFSQHTHTTAGRMWLQSCRQDNTCATLYFSIVGQDEEQEL